MIKCSTDVNTGAFGEDIFIEKSRVWKKPRDAKSYIIYIRNFRRNILFLLRLKKSSNSSLHPQFKYTWLHLVL